MKGFIRKQIIAALHDALMAAVSFILALWLRLGDDFSIHDNSFITATAIFTLASVAVFFLLSIYKRSWRYISLHDLSAITRAVIITILLFMMLMFMFNRLEGIPRSALFIVWFVMMALIGAPRFLYRMFREKSLAIDLTPRKTKKIAVLLIGANDHSELFLREASGNRNSEYKIIGIVDNDKTRIGQFIRNVMVYGDIANLTKIIDRLRKKNQAPQKIIITPDSVDASEVRDIFEVADDKGLTVATLPRLTDFKNTAAGKIEVKPIALEDLLGRPQNALNRETMRALIKGRRIMITGAGGTIGSELTRQIASYKPSHICLFEISEHNLYQIDKELEEKFPDINRKAVIGDIKDESGVKFALDFNRPEIVFHAAALKHVPMSEVNICEAILTNIIGTKILADACMESGVREMVMISTDKAVNPTNVMGASKRAAETYIQKIGRKKGHGTKFATVRFGNVLGSTGSVIPLFQRQIEEGGPITVTSPKVTRYFMTVREAVELVLQASALAYQEEAEETRIYVLDMGEPVLIKDLAEQMIRLAGLRPGTDIKIKYTGLRAGEKLYEELFYDSETRVNTELQGVMLAVPKENKSDDLEEKIKKILNLAGKKNDKSALKLLKEIVPEFK